MLLTHQMTFKPLVTWTRAVSVQVSALEWVQGKMGEEEMEAGPMGITWE